MNITRYDPLVEVDDFIDRYMRTFNRPLMRRGEAADFDWAPVADISENNDEYIIQMEAPGVEKDDIKISINRDLLTVRGERREKREEGDVKHHRVERSYGSFMRSFSLPPDVDEENVKAEYNDGMLNLHLPKSEEAKPKSVDIQVQ